MSTLIQTPEAVVRSAILSEEAFHKNQHNALHDPTTFWGAKARATLDWMHDFSEVLSGGFDDDVRVKWFSDGTLNVAANCLDRHVAHTPDKTALIWLGDEEGVERRFSYRELLESTSRWADLLKQHGVKRGDTVVVYLPMIPESVMVMLACARIGAVHSVVFAGFSPQALRDRIADSNAHVVVTADQSVRGGKIFPLKANVDQALKKDKNVSSVLIVPRTGADIAVQEGRDHIITDAVLGSCRMDVPPEEMNAEDPLFILYTSGSTGKPKGLVHSQAGYALYAAETFKTSFDYKEGDVYFCTADVGWITGHSYIVYGPLICGATVVMHEGVPTYPSADRLWKIVDHYKVTLFYTAPTAIRALMQLGDEHLKTTRRDSLRVLGSVGEPINPEAWLWYFHKVGKEKAAVVDTWWQTETGGHMIAPPPGTRAMKLGFAMTALPGIDPVLLDTQGQEIKGEGEGGLFIRHPWPGMARTIYGDHARYVQTYFSQAKAMYCTGDGAVRDADGHLRITGRVDDVINVSGHRFGTAEIEAALTEHDAVSEAAVVGREHAIKGTGIYAYVTLNEGTMPDDVLKKELNTLVRSSIGAIASLDWVQWAPALPKTRSGKIMRRILRKIAAGEIEGIGDTSTLADPACVDMLIENRQP